MMAGEGEDSGRHRPNGPLTKLTDNGCTLRLPCSLLVLICLSEKEKRREGIFLSLFFSRLSITDFVFGGFLL
jgi:hypothetical protein